MKMYPLLFFASLIIILGCKPTDIDKGHALLMNCIEAHGGLNKWHQLTETQYQKETILYHEDGSIEKALKQTHHYTTVPSLSGTISWKDSLTNKKIVYMDDTAYEVIGDKKEAPTSKALNTFNSAYYVLNMPWKLLDKEAKVTYAGLDTILEDRIVHTLEVTYPTSSGKQDSWQYYLDHDEYFLVANRVHHGTTYSLITNDEYTEYKGLKFNARRTSYRVDSTGKILYTRARYKYIF